MGPSWAPTFLFAAGLTCFACLVLGRGGSGHLLEGVASAKRIAAMGLVGGVIIGGGLGTGSGSEGLVIVVGAAVFVGVGLLADLRRVPRRFRVMVQLAMSALPVVAGLRLSITGLLVTDIVLTPLWVFAITHAFALIGNIDSLVGGLGAVGAASVFVLAIFVGEQYRATAAAAMVGACLGFFPFAVP